MADAQTKTFKVGSVQRRTVLQLLFCHCLIIAVSLLYGATAPAIICASLLSFLLMLNIPYNLHQLEIGLYRLARGLSVEPISSRLHWPLTRLFVLVDMLSQRSGQQVQLEQRTVAYRDQLLQQVGKTAAQEERNRLARDLHDSIKQQIFSIVVSAAAVKARWEHDPTSARKVVDDIERTAQEAQVEMQAMLQQLRPTALENVGLIESLRMQCQALGYRTGAEVTAELSDLPPDALLPIGAQEMIFRIVQEGFANIARHARASRVWLSLQRQSDALLVEIGDDGQGFDLGNERSQTYDSGMGLSNVRERVSTLGGTVSIWSLPDKGTTLHLCIPLVQSQSSVEERERTNQELVTAFHKNRRVLRVGIWAAELAAAFMLIYTPVLVAQWLVGICIIVALGFWLWAQQHQLQFSLDVGRQHAQHFALQAESQGLLSGTLLLCLLYPNYFTAFRYAVVIPSILWLVLSVYGMLIIAIIVTSLRSVLNSDRYYKTLSREERPGHIRRQLQQITIDWAAWASTIVLTIVLWNFFSPIVQDSFLQDMDFILLFAWFVITLAKSLRIARWHRALGSSAEQAIPDRKGGIV